MQRQLLEDRIFNLVVEWCDTPQVRAAGCSYQDCAVMYDLKSDQPITMVGDSPNNNLYLHIAHPLLQPRLADPVLKNAEERLLKFYAQTFWLNNDAALRISESSSPTVQGSQSWLCSAFIGVAVINPLSVFVDSLSRSSPATKPQSPWPSAAKTS